MKTFLSSIFILALNFSLFAQTDEPIKADEVEYIMPRFPGCEELPTIKEKKMCADTKLLQFIQQHITTPDSSKIVGIDGRCFVTFYIEPDGKVSEIVLVRDIGLGCGEEALRVVNLMVEQNIIWIPGEIKGKKTRIKFNLPVHFRIPKQFVRKKKKRRKRSKN